MLPLIKCPISSYPFFILIRVLLAFDSVKESLLFLTESDPLVAKGTGSELCVFSCIDL